MPECDNDQQLADEFAEFFAKKTDRIRSDLDHYPEYIPDHKDIPVMDKFLPISQEEILKQYSAWRPSIVKLTPSPRRC